MKLFFIKAENANRAGDVTTAEDESRKAKTFNILGLVCGIIVIIFYIVYILTKQEHLKSLYSSSMEP